MSGRSVSIAFMMKLTALIALNLAALRLVPTILQYPRGLFVLVTFDILLVQNLLLRAPRGVFHYTFILVGLVSSSATSLLLDRPSRNVGSLHVLETLLGKTLPMAERCVTSTLSLVPAWAAGLLAVGLERRGWRIKAFFGGALIGIAAWVLAIFIFAMVWDWPAPLSELFWDVYVVAMAACPLLGGLAGLFMSRSAHRRADDSEP